MNPVYYYILHVFALLVLTAQTFAAFANPAPENRKRTMITSGIASLLMIIAGFGLISKVYSNQFAGWMFVKMACWLVMTAVSGIAYRKPELRGVKGEMIIVETDEIAFSRPIRLIHPRFPLYLIPRADHRCMIGATSIESEDRGVSVRSALELLSAAYAVHPAFGEARIVEFGSGLRPAFPDNLPRIRIDNERIAVNGLYRHGFLIAPALAELTLAYVERGQIDNEVMQCA